MPRECAFCPNTAKLTREHLWSDWMNKLLPGRKRLIRRGPNREIITSRRAPTIDWKAKVVCEPCNNGWMSRIEDLHAKPAMSDLLLGKTGIPVDSQSAYSLALFTFKTAVVLDALADNSESFFDRETRHAFRESLSIPSHVRMWLNAFVPGGMGRADASYNESNASASNGVQMYVCTFLVQHLILQLVACKVTGFTRLSRKDKFLAVPFWPEIPNGFIWPPSWAITTIEEFDLFADGWKQLNAS